jgi:ATP-binding cassette subfamily B (MDR/TAP) protein 1
MALYAVLLTGVATLLMFFSQFLFNYSSHLISSRIKSKCFNTLMKQEVGYFDIKKLGSITNVISEDVNRITGAVGINMQFLCMYGTQFVLGIVLAVVDGWQIALMQASCIPILLFILAVIGVVVEYTSKRTSELTAETTATANEVFSCIRTVRSMAGEKREKHRYYKGVDKLGRIGWITAIAKGIASGCTQMLFWGAFGLAIWYAGVMVDAGLTNGGTVFEVFGFAFMSVIAFGQLFTVIPELVKSIVSAKMLLRIILREPKIRFRGGIRPPVKGQIDFVNIKFKYPARPNVTVLDKFNLTIEPGQSVALVGPSGSGKSTVVGLLQRWYEQETGRVLIDGIDIRDWDPVWLHQCIGLVSQEPTLFATSIYRNISYAVDTINQRIEWECKSQGLSKDETERKLIPVNDELVLKAAVAANAHNFIMDLEHGYDTKLGERGLTLSGGQKQRIAIARAIMLNPKILLLDEATSALDSSSERVVQDALEKLMVGRTSIVIAHRLSTIANSDRIIVMKSGVVTESGTHAELLELKGTYYNLASKEMRERSELPASPQISAFDLLSGIKTSIQIASINKYTNEKELEDSNRPKMLTTLPILRAFSGYWISIIIGQCGAMVSGATLVIVYFLLGLMIDGITPGRNSDGVLVPFRPGYNYIQATNPYAIYMAILAAVAGVASFVDNFLSNMSDSKISIRLKKMFFRHVLKQEIGFFDIRKSGGLQQTIAEIPGISSAFTVRLSVFMQNTSMFLASVIISFFATWELTLIVLAAGIPVFAIIMCVAAVVDDYLNGRLSNVQASSLITTTEVMGSIRTIRSMAGEEREMQRFSNDLQKLNRLGLIKALAVAFSYGGFEFSTWGVTALALQQGGRLVASGKMTAGGLVQVTGYIYFAMIGVMMALYEAQNFFKAHTGAKNVLQVTERTPLINTSGGQRVERVTGRIEFKDVSFAYPSRPNNIVLNRFSLTVDSGKRVGLVGESGSGKSTISALLERFYDPLAGNVLLDDVDLRDWDPKQLHKTVAIVMQEPVLFAGSILNNITYAMNKQVAVDMNAVVQAAKDANCYNFISQLPDGFDTILGDRGVSLSGGQKQRIAIARAMLQDASVLLLDEATSALDNTSEKLVQEALTKLMEGRTTIIIAHRLSTIQDCDEIIVMRKGKIMERGTHKELIAMDGMYKKLVEKQMEG